MKKELLQKEGVGMTYKVFKDSLELDASPFTVFETAMAAMGWPTEPPFPVFEFERIDSESDYTATINVNTEAVPLHFTCDIDGVETQHENGEQCKDRIRHRENKV